MTLIKGDLAANKHDTLEGTSAHDVIYGYSYNDRLYGGGGNDMLYGGIGNDYLEVIHSGYSKLYGEIGDDTIYVGGVGAHSLYGGVGNDSITDKSSGKSKIWGDAGNDKIIVYDGNHYVEGGAGNDTITSYTSFSEFGASTLIGGLGNDRYIIYNQNDVIIEEFSGGVETIEVSINYKLGDNVENLILTGNSDRIAYGNDLNNYIVGNEGSNKIYGYGGHDVLDSTGNFDTLYGGLGNDTYYVVNADNVVETANEGYDTVKTAGSYTLEANLEELILVGDYVINGAGNGAANQMTGNANVNNLYGGDGNDTLRGSVIVYRDDGSENVLLGNDGKNDTLHGGDGNDTYEIRGSGDVIMEDASKGTDTVLSYISYTLGNNVENLTFRGGASLVGKGNNLHNALKGNGAVNSLYGGNGNDTFYDSSGNDSLYGGSGNDIYFIYDNDILIEDATGGIDTVKSYINYTLKNYFENLVLQGKDEIYGVGNSLDNIITGNSVANKLYGGDGSDTLCGDLSESVDGDVLYGGGDNDTYIIDDFEDEIVEFSTGGIDTVNSYVDINLNKYHKSSSAISDLENIVLLGNEYIDATGNGLGNIITGNSKDNIIAGGSGNDTLIGGGGKDNLAGDSGADIFIYKATSDSSMTSHDVIGNFMSGQDKIDLHWLDANAALSGNQIFTFTDTDAKPNGVWYRDIGSSLMVYADTNKDSNADLAIELTNINGIKSTDFIL